MVAGLSWTRRLDGRSTVWRAPSTLRPPNSRFQDAPNAQG
jgi:hypothetical protein